MNPIEWYYARDNRQMGPVSSVELKRLATANELGPDDLVWREGMTEWAAARNVKGLFDEEGRGAAPAANEPSFAKEEDSSLKIGESTAKPQNPTPLAPASRRHLFDILIDKYRPHFDERFVNTTAGIFQGCGSYGLFVAAALTGIFAIAMATKINPLGQLLWGATWVLALLALQYVAGKAFAAIDELNRTTAGRLSSAVLPNCVAILGKVVGVAALFGSIASAVETSNYLTIFPGVAAFFVCVYLSAIALNPSMLNISIAPETLAGEEAIGVLMFVLKSILRLTPVAFGAGILCGMLSMGLACYLAFAGDAEALATASAARHVLLYSAALPLAAYLLFLLGNLVMNLWRSVLSLSAKLDKLAEKNEEESKP